MQESALLHLVLGDSVAGCLRQAALEFGIPGRVLASNDDPSHGPLHDEGARSAYLTLCLREYSNCGTPQNLMRDGFWGDVLARADLSRHKEICVWAGDNVSESLFLAMSCHCLADFGGSVTRVGAHGLHQLPYIGPQTPRALAELFVTRQHMTAAKRTALAREYCRLRQERGALRRWENGRIVTVPVDSYDAMIVACCTTQWLHAARIVGIALANCDANNLLSDVFVNHRLQALIDTGQIEFKGNRSGLRNYSIRRSG